MDEIGEIDPNQINFLKAGLIYFNDINSKMEMKNIVSL